MIAASLADSSPSQDDDSASQTFEGDPEFESKIIGPKEFNTDDRILDAHKTPPALRFVHLFVALRVHNPEQPLLRVPCRAPFASALTTKRSVHTRARSGARRLAARTRPPGLGQVPTLTAAACARAARRAVQAQLNRHGICAREVRVVRVDEDACGLRLGVCARAWGAACVPPVPLSA